MQCTMTRLEKRLVLRLDESTCLTLMVGKTRPYKNSQSIETSLMELVYSNNCKLSHRIPRQIMCLDEKYRRHCLELIHISAGKISLHTSSLNTGVSLESFVFPLAGDKYPSASADCFSKCSLPTGLENVNSSLPGNWIIGSINGSKSMKNILKHPMLRRVGDLEDEKDDSDLEFRNSTCHSIICLAQKLNRFDVMSGIDMSGMPLSDLGEIFSHGMLQCTLTGGNPHYVFSVDENREVYEVNLLSMQSSANEGMQWIYSFNLQNERRKEASTKELSDTGTMKVSAHFITCPNNFKIMETEFVLYGLDEKIKDESASDPLCRSLQSNKGVSKKALIPFKPSLSLRKRTKSMFWRSSSTKDSCPWSPPTEVHKTSKKKSQPYCEIASIIMRNHINIPPKEIVVAEPGGWGASILKRVTHNEAFQYQDDHICSSKCIPQCNNKFCSTTDILIPAGYHSLPETVDGVPSSLIERWKSGGRCDCGGWDIGCPLTVFTTRSNKYTALRPTGKHVDSLFEVVLKGTERHPPQMKMVNVSKDLYYLNFRSSLSALQCFAIAVAVLHCKNAMLQTKMLQELESPCLKVGKDAEFAGKSIVKFTLTRKDRPKVRLKWSLHLNHEKKKQRPKIEES